MIISVPSVRPRMVGADEHVAVESIVDLRRDDLERAADEG